MLKVPSVALAVYLLVLGGALAGEVTVEIEGAAPAAARADGRVTRADEKALRYYARQGRMERVEAEARRLKRKDPEWSIPDDLFEASAPGPDTQPIWELVAAGRYAEARAAIAEKQGARPGWRPEPELVRAIERGEARVRLLNASEAGQSQAVIRIAQANPELLSCESVDLMWRAARAYADIGDSARAAGVYRRIMRTCGDFDVRLATLQKAHGRIGDGDFADLAEMEAKRPHGPDQAARYRDTLDDLSYGTRLARLADGDLGRKALGRLADQVKDREDAGAAAAIGWHHHRKGRHDTAIRWFERGRDWAGADDTETGALEGLVRAHAVAGNWRRALEIGRTGKGRDPAVHAAYVDVERSLLVEDAPGDVDEATLQEVAGHVLEHEDVRSAVLFGWRRWRNDMPVKARIWFDRALAWGAGDEAATGLALALHATGETDRLQRLADAWMGRSERFAGAVRPFLGGGSSPAAEALAVGNYRGCAEALSELDAWTTGDRLVGGWCFLNLERPAEAIRHFEVALDGGDADARRDARYGLALAHMRQGDQRAVMALLDGADFPEGERRRLRAQMVGSWLQKAYEAGRYPVVVRLAKMLPDDRGAQILRGWALVRMNQKASAYEVFKDLDAVLSTPDTREALEVIEKGWLR